jgi:hypothetical protein
MFWIRKSVNDRQSISRTDLQSAIANAVKQSDPDCKAFIDVIVEYTTPKSRLDANWVIKGIRFGKSDRQKAHHAIALIVEQLQRQFSLSES